MVWWITIAWDIVEDVRGSCAMFMFIIEEAVQTIGMACYLAQKKKQWNVLREYADFALYELIEPALQFVDQYGNLAYPLNGAYKAFFEAAKKTFLQYKQMAAEGQ